jgi:hypothetical protein
MSVEQETLKGFSNTDKGKGKGKDIPVTGHGGP